MENVLELLENDNRQRTERLQQKVSQLKNVR